MSPKAKNFISAIEQFIRQSGWSINVFSRRQLLQQHRVAHRYLNQLLKDGHIPEDGLVVRAVTSQEIQHYLLNESGLIGRNAHTSTSDNHCAHQNLARHLIDNDSRTLLSFAGGENVSIHDSLEYALQYTTFHGPKDSYLLIMALPPVYMEPRITLKLLPEEFNAFDNLVDQIERSTLDPDSIGIRKSSSIEQAQKHEVVKVTGIEKGWFNTRLTFQSVVAIFSVDTIGKVLGHFLSASRKQSVKGIISNPHPQAPTFSILAAYDNDSADNLGISTSDINKRAYEASIITDSSMRLLSTEEASSAATLLQASFPVRPGIHQKRIIEVPKDISPSDVPTYLAEEHEKFYKSTPTSEHVFNANNLFE